MNRCLRSLSCFFTLAGLAIFSTDATARPSHKPNAQKAHAASEEVARGEGGSPSSQRCVRKNAGRPNTPTHKRKSKPSKAAPAPKETVAVAPLTGDLALVKEAIDLARKAKTERGDGHQEQDRGSGGAEARRVVHPAPSGNDRAFQPLRGVHRRQSGMAERGAAAPARRGAAVAAAQRCGDGSRLHRRPARQRQGQAGAGARAARRGRSRRRGAGWRAMHGDRTNCRSASRPTCSRRSATCSPAMTTVRAWTGASAPRISPAPSAPRSALAATSLRS